jgi:hypothetical protein
MWLSLVEHFVRDEETVGSNPTIQTRSNEELGSQVARLLWEQDAASVRIRPPRLARLTIEEEVHSLLV